MHNKIYQIAVKLYKVVWSGEMTGEALIATGENSKDRNND
jgi:hypothetical protein